VFGETAVHKACRTGSIPLVKSLIEAGSDITKSGYCGRLCCVVVWCGVVV